MAIAKANGIEIDYAEYTDDAAIAPSAAANGGPPVLVLLRGLGTQRIEWPEALLDGLTARGMRVICPDNRDVGGSSKFEAAGIPDVPAILAGREPAVPAAYQLADMADDVVGLLDVLGIGRAHVAGISMGGMIVQRLAIDHAERLHSMTSIMSSSGAPGLPAATPEAMTALTSQPDDPDSRESVIENMVRSRKLFASPGHPTPADIAREMAARAYDRCHHPQGITRQMAAVMSDRDRHTRLSEIETPTLVVHGEDDPLIPLACGRDTAERIPGARFEAIAGMGHDVPAALAATWTGLIADHVEAHHPR